MGPWEGEAGCKGRRNQTARGGGPDVNYWRGKSPVGITGELRFTGPLGIHNTHMPVKLLVAVFLPLGSTELLKYNTNTKGMQQLRATFHDPPVKDYF